MGRAIGRRGLELIKYSEGLYTTAYQDSVGVWTIGYGHTGEVNGRRIHRGMTISKDKAEDLLVADLRYFANKVDDKKYVPIKLNRNQRDALISFAFNLGEGNLQRLCRHRTAAQISECMLSYNTAGGRELRGLTIRRHAEQRLFNSKAGLTSSDEEDDIDTKSKTASINTSLPEKKKAEKKDITSVKIINVAGRSSTRVSNNLSSTEGSQVRDLLIQNGSKVMYPVISELTLTQERKGSPATLEFTAYKTAGLDFVEGNAVRFLYNTNKVFFGYVFKKTRSDGYTIKATCYDQIRYLKSKDTIIYQNKKYSDLVNMIAADYKLKTGYIADTKYIIPTRIDEETTLLDILQNASDETVLNTAQLYVLYDDFGELTLRHISEMFVDVYISQDNMTGYDYSSDIENTYNRVKIAIDNDKTGVREVYMTQDAESQWRYGILNYYEKINGPSVSSSSSSSGSSSSSDSFDADMKYKINVAKKKSEVLLKYYNKKQRSLSIKGCYGNEKVRGGSVIFCSMDLGDISVNSQMIVEKVTHKWSEGSYTMDLTLIGGEDLNFV